MFMRISPRTIILRLKKNKLRVSQTAEELGIHPTTIYRWKKRADRYGVLSSWRLRRRSTRPQRVRYALSGSEEAAIITFRKRYGSTAEKIKVALKLMVHHRTIHRFLRRTGHVRQYGYHRRPIGQPTIHMHLGNTPTVGYLQMDVKFVTPELSGLPWTCYEYAIIDIYSRYKEGIILNQLDQDGAMIALIEMLPKFPFKPVFIQTDNGLEFQKRFTDMCTQLNLRHHHVHKKSPNENAIIERSFRTDEEEFFFRMERRPSHYDELREWFATYLTYYNQERLHLGIHCKTPAQVVAEVVSD